MGRPHQFRRYLGPGDSAQGLPPGMMPEPGDLIVAFSPSRVPGDGVDRPLIRREAEELCAGFEGDSCPVAKIRRQRAEVLRRKATMWERWVETVRRMGEEDAASIA